MELSNKHKLRARLFKKQRGLCKYCDCQMTTRNGRVNSWTLDHILPMYLGGDDNPANIVLACDACNRDKGSKSVHEWLEVE